MIITLNMIWFKGVFCVCMNIFKTSYDLTKKKKIIYIYTIKYIGEIIRVFPRYCFRPLGMQLCFIVEFYHHCDPSRLKWGLVWIWYGLKIYFVCAQTRSRHLMA